MSIRSPRRVLPPIAAIILAVLGCGDIAPPTAPGTVPGEPQLAKTPARPTGTGIGVIGSEAGRTRQRVQHPVRERSARRPAVDGEVRLELPERPIHRGSVQRR